MPQCCLCGTETELYVAGSPMCERCDDSRIGVLPTKAAMPQRDASRISDNAVDGRSAEGAGA